MNELKPVTVTRDEDGFFCHPEYSKLLDELLGDREFPSFEEWEVFKKKLNIIVKPVYLDCDADEDVVERYYNGNLEVCAEWYPSKPDDSVDWFIVSIHDTEDGAVCLWAKNGYYSEELEK